MAAGKNKASGSTKSKDKSRPASKSQLNAPAPDPINTLDEGELSAKKAKVSRSGNGKSSATQRYSEVGNTIAQRNGLNGTVAGANGLFTGPDDIGKLSDDQANLDTNIDDLNEPTLGERLKALKVGAMSNGISRDQDDDDDDDDEGEGDASKVALPQGSLSLGQTLTQALHSNDTALLSSCLAHSDPTVIRSSVLKLSGPLAVKLLEHCVDRMARGGKRSTGALGSARTRGIIEWVRATLIVHTGYFMSLPNLVHRLSALHATLSGRLASHERLLALNGRLELVLGQIEMRQAYSAEQARRVQGVRGKAKNGKGMDADSQKKAQLEGKHWVEESSDEEERHAQNGMDVDEDELESSDEADDVVRGEEEGVVQDIALGNDTFGNTSIDTDEEKDEEAGSAEDVEMSGEEEESEEEDEDEDDDEEDEDDEDDEDDESALDEEGDSDEFDEEEDEDGSEDGKGKGLLDLEAESTDGDDDEEDGSEESD